MSNNITKTRFIEWRNSTDEERVKNGLPLTQKDFSSIYGISEQTLSNWNRELDNRKSKPRNSDFNLQVYLRENLEEIAQSLVTLIRTGKNAKGVEIALKALGELVEKQEIRGKIELTPTDINEIAIRTVEGLREQYRQGGGICPVCGRPQTFCAQSRLDSEPEQPKDREVAPVGLLARPD